MTKPPITYGGRQSGKTAALKSPSTNTAAPGEITAAWVDEAKNVDVTAIYASIGVGRYHELFTQRWPAPTQAERDCHDRFGRERAEQMIRQAHRRAQQSRDSFEDTLELLMAQETIARRMDSERQARELPFSYRIKGWPKPWL